MYICKNRVGDCNFQAANPRQTIIKPSRPVSVTNRSIRVNTTGCKSSRCEETTREQHRQPRLCSVGEQPGNELVAEDPGNDLL